MTHLYIEQNNSVTEEVNSSIISKLYELAISGDLDESSDLKGRLHSNMTYRSYMEYLNTTYPDLYISADDFAIPFEDPNMLQFLLNKGIGSNGMITENQAAAVTTISTESNATITKFNELKYFTSITATNTYTTKFIDWTALEEIDVSNFTRVGGATNGDWQGSFLRCAALKKVTASSKLTMFGHAAFNECSNLEQITGVTGAVSVGCSAFKNCSKLPQSFFQPLIVTLTKTDSSGEHFYGCTLLQSINIAEGTTEIPVKCFYNCTNLASITIPSTLTTVEGSAFERCTALTSIDLSNVTDIYQEAFKNSGLTGTIDVTSLSQTQAYPFNSCNGITRLDFGSLPANMNTISNGLCGYMSGLQTVTGLSDITTIVSAMFANDTNLSSIDIDWSKITFIGSSAFQQCSSLALSNLSIPNLTTVQENAFQLSGVTSVSDLGSITRLSNSMFRGCTSLTSVVLPNTLTETGGYSLADCTGLTTINFPSSLTTINSCCFQNCTNLDVTVDLSNITLVTEKNFYNCKKVKISNLPKTSSYPSQAFYGMTSLTSIIIPKEVTSFGNSSFADCSNLQSVTFESNSQLTSLTAGAFSGCSALSSIIIPEGCTTLGQRCFRNCDSMTLIDIPSTVTRVEYQFAFNQNGANITPITVIFRCNLPTFTSDTDPFNKQSQYISIYVPDDQVNAYKAATCLSRYTNNIFGLSQLPNS